MIDTFSFAMGAVAAWILMVICLLVEYKYKWGFFYERQSQFCECVDPSPAPVGGNRMFICRKCKKPIKLQEKKPNLPDAVIRAYMRNWPGWSWRWTTIGPDNRPYILIERMTKHGRHWHVLTQDRIEKCL